LPPRDGTVRVMLASTAITVAGNGDPIDCEDYTEAVIYVVVTAKSGTSPTLDANIETSHNETDWHHIADIPQVNDPTIPASGRYVHAVYQLTNFGPFIRFQYPAPGGSSTPSLTTEVRVALKN